MLYWMVGHPAFFGGKFWLALLRLFLLLPQLRESWLKCLTFYAHFSRLLFRLYWRLATFHAAPGQTWPLLLMHSQRKALTYSRSTHPTTARTQYLLDSNSKILTNLFQIFVQMREPLWKKEVPKCNFRSLAFLSFPGRCSWLEFLCNFLYPETPFCKNWRKVASNFWPAAEEWPL